MRYVAIFVHIILLHMLTRLATTPKARLAASAVGGIEPLWLNGHNNGRAWVYKWCTTVSLSSPSENDRETDEIKGENRGRVFEIKRQTYPVPVLFTRKELDKVSK